MNTPIRVGIVGAGLNSDYHINFSKAYEHARIVGVADRDFPRAQECARKQGLPAAYASVAELLRKGNPDVVHVVTPPRTHLAVAREVLEAGKHALVEKPLALNAEEASELYALAERRGVLLCPVHNHLFDPCMRTLDSRVKTGALGRVTNVESYYGLNTNIPAFRDYPRPNVLPWLYQLPGGVYQDFLPHALYVLLEYTGAPRKLTVMHRSTGVLPQDLPDEIRVLVDGERAFGTLTFSFAARPHLHFVRVYGTNMMVEADINSMTTVVHRVSSLPKAAQKATYNLEDSWQRACSTFANTFNFVTGKLKPYQGMRALIHSFYDSARSGNPPPIARQQALAVVRTMDAVFEQLKCTPLTHDRIIPAPRPLSPHAKKVLVTGGTGFVGKALVRRLLAEGHTVRVLARKLANVDALVDLGAEIYWGDVADVESFEQAFPGCDTVIHLAAGTSGSEKDSRTGTIEGTNNLLELCRRHKPEKLVYISSCSVYGIADCQKNARVSETRALERFPDRRGSYSASKQRAEGDVIAFMKSGDVPVTVLRPGTIYGPGGDLYTPMMGFAVGDWHVVIGTGAFQLPFVYVDNVVDAIVTAMSKPESSGEIFNVVDPEPISKRDYINRVIRRVRPGARVLYMPFSLLFGITWLQEIAFGVMKRRPVLTRYRLTSSQKPIVYDSSKIMYRLGWTPPVPLDEALGRVIAAETSKQGLVVSGSPEASNSEAA